MRSTEQIESDIRTVRGLFEANRHLLEALAVEHLSVVTKAFFPDAAELLYECEYDSSLSGHFPFPTGVVMVDGTYAHIDPASEAVGPLLADLESLCEVAPDTYLSLTSIAVN